MFDTLPTSYLATMLEQFSFPMLAAERPDPRADFRIIAFNTALSDVAGPEDTLQDMRLSQVLPRFVVEQISQAFSRQALPHKAEQLRAVTCGVARSVPCDLTLQYLRSQDGNDRVIVTAQEARAFDLDLDDRIAFEDIRYFSFLADLQLENLNCAFANAAENGRIEPINDDRMIRLHAVCKTIQRTVSDIKDVVQQAQTRHRSRTGISHVSKARAVITSDRQLCDVISGPELMKNSRRH